MSETPEKRAEPPPLLDDAALPIAAALAVFAVALGIVMAGGGPVAWLDTYNDERLVRECLNEGHCSLAGVEASQRDVLHANAWILLRTFFEWIGLGLQGTHHLAQLSLAATAVLIVWLATRLGGRLAGALAVGWLVSGLQGLRIEALYNSSLLPFLGVVQLLAATAFLARPSAGRLALHALVAGVATNVHSQCATSVLTTIALAMLAPERRGRMLLVGLGTYGVATFAFAPVGWIDNAYAAVARVTNPAQAGHAMTTGGRISDADLPWVPLLVYGVLIARRSPLRRKLDAPVAVFVPPLVAFVALGLAHATTADTKYLLHATPAATVGFAVAVAIASKELARGFPQLERVIESPWLVAIVALAGVTTAVRHRLSDAQERDTRVQVADVESAGELLRARHWDLRTMLALTSTTETSDVLEGWWVLHPEWYGDAVSPLPHERAMVFHANRPRPADWPETLDWVDRSDGGVVVAVVPTGLDLESMEICVTRTGVPTECRAATMARRQRPVRREASYMVEGMPMMLPDLDHVSVRYPWSSRAGASELVHMPHAHRACQGAVTAVPAGSTIENGGRDARLEGAAGVVELTWTIGPDCNHNEIQGRPPFFLTGSPEAMRAMRSVLDEGTP